MSFPPGYAADPRGYWQRRGRTYFDEEAEIRGPRSPTTWQGLYLVQQIRRLMGRVDPGYAVTVLELGCGYGRLLHELRQHEPHWHLIGVDFSEAQLGQAGQYCDQDQIDLYLGHGSAIPVPAKSVDVAYTQGCLMHVLALDLLPIQRELRRVSAAIIHVEESTAAGDYISVHDYSAGYLPHGWVQIWREPYPVGLPGQSLVSEGWRRGHVQALNRRSG